MAKASLHDLIRVYQDLERTLRHLKASAERNLEDSFRGINVRKLIRQLSRSKRKLERKIGNTLLLEKQHLKRKLREIATSIAQRASEP